MIHWFFMETERPKGRGASQAREEAEE